MNRNGYNKVSRWQRMAIITTYNAKSRADACVELALSPAGLNDLLYRAYKVLGVRNLKEAWQEVADTDNDD